MPVIPAKGKGKGKVSESINTSKSTSTWSEVSTKANYLLVA
jgi:hypothetical protein